MHNQGRRSEQKGLGVSGEPQIWSPLKCRCGERHGSVPIGDHFEKLGVVLAAGNVIRTDEVLVREVIGMEVDAVRHKLAELVSPWSEEVVSMLQEEIA